MQGWRKTMEDACITQQLENSFSGKKSHFDVDSSARIFILNLDDDNP